MAPLTPQITLTITLDDLTGLAVGSTSNPAYVRIMLCGYGPYLPRVPATALIGSVDTALTLPYQSLPLSVPLWGNDVIIPGGTYYSISILDSNKNVIQTGAYVFTGAGTFDLSTLSPTFPSYVPTVFGGLVVVPFSATPIFDASLVNGPIAFDLTLSGNVTSSTLVAPQAGQIVTFIFQQDGTGGWTFVWPSNVLNAGIVDTDADSVTVQSFIARANGFLYPIGPQTYTG